MLILVHISEMSIFCAIKSPILLFSPKKTLYVVIVIEEQAEILPPIVLYSNQASPKTRLGLQREVLWGYNAGLESLGGQGQMELSSRVSKFFHRQSDIEKASELIALQPGDARGYKMRAVAYAKVDKYFEAYKDLQIAIDLAPDDAECHYLMGACQNKRSRYQEALDSFNTSLELDPKLAGAYVGRAWARQALGINDNIRDDLQKGLDLTGNRYLKKMVEGMIKEFDEAGDKKKRKVKR